MSPSPPGAEPYPWVEQEPRFPLLEQDVLEFWAQDGTFAASVAARDASDEFVFYDGPPFANGLPHYGHLLTGFVKDAVPRYQTMRGRRVERRFGWDCHGLPAEMQAEKELDLPGRAAIAELGVGRFNDYCRSLVQRTTDAWERYVTRQARWVDFVDDYRTMDITYMESVMWAFATLWAKGLVYEGERVLPYCWECETPLSNFETRQDDAYRARDDPAVTVAFELLPGKGDHAHEQEGDGDLLAGAVQLLVWTTTPWTLPSNLALAVDPDMVYGVYDVDGAITVLARDRAAAYQDVLGDGQPLVEVHGRQLVGRRYRPLFDFFADEPGAFVVLGAGFVTADEGTGIVHLAPGFGEDDHDVCAEAGIAVVCPVDDRGRFTAQVPPYAGRQVFEANDAVIADLWASGVLRRAERYVHSYPHCWRTDTPLIYKSVSSWFVAVAAIKAQMSANNQEVSWIPGHVRDGAFGRWLEGARDWSISRNRFWGAPIPVWKSDDPAFPRVDVYSSLDELARDFGARPDDLHRPAIDELTRPNPDDPSGRATMRRVSDVLDCWFESGSMPFAQVHYPFERSAWFESHFPADFIVEYIGQTRGWFYTLHVLATALFDRPAFSHCMAHGIVLGDDGRKMSKRLGNYPDPDMVFERWGADAMRWFLLSSPVLRGQDLVVASDGFQNAERQVLRRIWNTWYFLTLYANTDGLRGRIRTDQRHVLDRYILAKTAELVDDVTTAMDAYDLYGACSSITAYLDALTNWYVRRSRPRFWGRSDTAERAGQRAGGASPAGTPPQAVSRADVDAVDTLHTVLHTLCRVSAPLLPLLTEHIYRQLTGERSVHLTDWPDPKELPHDHELVRDMDMVRAVCSAAHAIRKANGLRARLPLATLTVATTDHLRLEPYLALVADEVNVKEVVVTDDLGAVAEEVLSVVPGVLGPRIGASTQNVIAAVKRGEWRSVPGGVEVAGIVLPADQGGYELTRRPRDERTTRALPDGAGVVVLDIDVTAELVAEGLARDVVRLVQEARRQAGLQVSDRIVADPVLPGEEAAAVDAHRAYVAEQTLATALRVRSGDHRHIAVHATSS